MKITFLGTGTSQGIPVIGSKHPVCLSHDFKDKRLRVSVLVEWDDYAYVVDCGPDFREQMLRVNCHKIDGILFTHEHSDHVAGLDDIRPFYFRQGDVQIYGHKRVIASLTKRFDYIFTTENKYPGVPTLSINVIENKPFMLHNLKVIPVNGMHHQLQVFGFRFKDFAYLTDMKSMEAVEIQKIKDQLLKELISTKAKILEYTDLSKPIAPENAIGRVSRMDAINNKSIVEAALRESKKKLIDLSTIKKKINSKNFGMCISCNIEIPYGRLIIRPNSKKCVNCAI